MHDIMPPAAPPLAAADATRPGVLRTLRQHMQTRAIIGLLPIVLAAGAASYVAASAYARLFERKLERLAEGLALTVDGHIGGLQMMLAALAQAHELNNDNDGALAGFVARSSLTAARYGTTIRGFRPDGDGYRMIFDTSQKPGRALPAITGPTAALLRTFQTGQPQVGNLHVDLIGGHRIALVYMPVIRDGQVIAALAAVIDGVALSAQLATPFVRQEALAAVLDENRTVVLRSQDPEAHVGKVSIVGQRVPWDRDAAFVPQAVALDGDTWSLAVARSHLAPGWHVLVGERTVAYRLSWLIPFAILAAGTAVACVMVVLAALRRARAVSRAMATLATAANAVARGEALTDRASRRLTDIREFEELRAAIDHAQARLDQEAHAARAGRALLQSVIDNLPDAVFVSDEFGRQVLVNGAARDLEHAGPTESGMPAALHGLLVRHQAEVRQTGRPVTADYTLDLPAGATRRHLAVFAPWREPDGGAQRGTIVISHDISGLGLAEQRLREQREEIEALARRATIGAMAGGLAHELSQPLTALTNYLGTIQRIMESLSDVRHPQQLALAMEAGRRAIAQATQAGGIVRSFREFVATKNPVRLHTDLACVVEDGVRLGMTGVRPRQVRTDIRIAPDLGSALVDRVQIIQVLVNLVRNALEAMAQTAAPELTVSARRLPVEDGGAVEIRVADRGPGVAAEIRAHLFEPFVSSKAEGMGLGLFICRSIIEAHGGKLELDVAYHPGACFVVQLG